MSFGEPYPAPRYPAPVVAQSLPRLDTSDLYELERRLIGVSAPTVPLPFAPDAPVSLAELARRRSLVVFFFPGATASTRWGEDPGTAQAWAWRERETELELLGCIVVGVSTPSPEAQAKFAADELLGYMLLSDTELELARELALPTMNVAGKRVYEPLTIVIHEGCIARVSHPEDPVRDAAHVTSWVREMGS